MTVKELWLSQHFQKARDQNNGEEIKVNISPKQKQIITFFLTNTHEINTNKRLRFFLLSFSNSCFVPVGKESTFP